MKMFGSGFVSVNALSKKGVPDDAIISKGIKHLRKIPAKDRYFWLRDQMSFVEGKPNENRVRSLCVDIAHGFKALVRTEESEKLHSQAVDFLENGMP